MEESILAFALQAKLHKKMCKQLYDGLNPLLQIFPHLEAVRPGCKSGMQALSALHLALEKAKLLIFDCASSSKLYLAMTGDSIVLKFARVTNDLDTSLVQVAEIVCESLSKKVECVRKQVSKANYILDPSEEQVGAHIISLLVKEKDGESGEEAIFEQIAVELGLVSPKSMLEERQALKELLKKAECVGDKKKVAIILYFLHCLKSYSKNIKSSSSNAIHVGKDESVCKDITRSVTMPRCAVSSMRQSECSSERLLIDVQEQLRCPICGQLMSDPVVIASGRTYERACIEKWFQEGNTTCPQTKQLLPNLSVTQNTCVKNLIASWWQESNGSLSSQMVDSIDEPASPPCKQMLFRYSSLSSADSSVETE